MPLISNESRPRRSRCLSLCLMFNVFRLFRPALVGGRRTFVGERCWLTLCSDWGKTNPSELEPETTLWDPRWSSGAELRLEATHWTFCVFRSKCRRLIFFYISSRRDAPTVIWSTPLLGHYSSKNPGLLYTERGAGYVSCYLGNQLTSGSWR